MSEVLQSPDHPAKIELSEMYTSEDNKKQSPYSVETPYGFHLDLDFLKYVDDIEKGNTIKKVYIHKKAKQPKYSTLPRNFSVTDTQFSLSDSRSYRKYGNKWMKTSSWAPTNRCKGTNIEELFKSSLSNHEPALLQSNPHDHRSGNTLSDVKESLGENGLSPQSCPKPPLLRASSVPVDFMYQQKLKVLENYGFRQPGNALVLENSNTPEVAPQLNVTLPQVHQRQQQIRIAHDRSKELEEQINIISELKQQVLVLQEEKKQLLLQLKTQQQLDSKATSSPVLERKAIVAVDDGVTTGTQCNSSATHLGSETVEEQTLFPNKSTTYEFFKSNETFQNENVTNFNHQINFASNVTASLNKKFDFSIHEDHEYFQNSSKDIEHKKRDVGVQVTIRDLRLVLVPHHSTERVSIKEPKNTFSRLENQVKGGAQELEVEHEDLDSSKYTQNQMEVCDTSNQPKIPSYLGTTKPELGIQEANESELMCKHDIQADLQSENCRHCRVNLTDANLIETRNFGINTDYVAVSDAIAVATIETREKATNATVTVCSKAVETEHDSILHCICHGTSTLSKGNKENTMMCNDSGDDKFNDLSNTKTYPDDGNSAVKGNRKECPVVLESQDNVCKKDNSQDAVYAFLQPDPQIISTKPELAQSIKKIEDLLCKQQSFLEQNYPELAQNFKKLCSSIGTLSIQLINSLQPWTSSLPTPEQSDRSSAVKECEPAESQPASLKSIMKKNSGNIKSSAPSAKKYLQFTGVNGGYETTSSEDSNSTEGGSDSDLEKERVNTGSQMQHSDNKSELAQDTKGTGYEEIQPSPNDVTVLPHCTKSHNWNQNLFLACSYLKDHLSELGATNYESVRQNLNTVQWEWFRMSSQKSAASDRVQAFLQELQEMSPELLHFIVNLADDNQNTALHYSVSHSNFHVVRHLLDTGMCNVDHQNKAGYTATMLASLTSAETDEEVAVVMQLLHLGNVNIQASQAGQTALMLAVCHGRIDVAKALLSSGANVNIQDSDGSTALMCASEHGHVEIVKLLLAQPECNSALTDKDGSTAMNIALQAGEKDIAELLSLHMNSGISPAL
ncbi:KN motif and ankyrin repeat domain-containing protein 4-like [Narcine bancroftii]|uniref:KN motif and ankyrin repeat domain-containing protein 4-like n=1 Tax=Narcine bancroftii TaxID=1343680 RepID=UPI0038322249